MDDTMLHDSNSTLSRAKEFYGYLILGMCAVFGTAMFAPIGITVHGAWFFWTFPLALALGVGYSITAMFVVLMFNLRDLGRIGEVLVGAFVGTVVLAIAGSFGIGMTLDSFGGAIAGGIIGTCTITILGTLSGRLQWYNVPLWVVRKPTIAQELASRRASQAATPPAPRLQLAKAVPMSDPNDNRSFDATFDKPVNLRFEHDGKVVFDQRCSGNIKLMLRDFAPNSGEVIVYIDDEPFGYWAAD
jgi:hypothetical protein